MSTQWMKILMSFVVLTTLAACSNGADLRSARASNQATGVTGSGGSSSCGVTTQVAGRVYDGGGSSSYTFEQRVKGLLAASVDPQYFGTISGDSASTATGVSMEGKIVYDASGNVNVSQTNLKLVVTDSFVGQTDASGKLVTAYPMNFASASSGTVNIAAKTFTVLFKDSYGEITLTGSYNSSTTTGSITYTNFSTVASGNFPTSGTLGAFQISTCSFIN